MMRFLDYILENLVEFFAGGAGLAIIVFLIKKQLDHYLQKSMEKYKNEISMQQSFAKDIKKYNYDEESNNIKELWKQIKEVIEICGKYTSHENNNELQIANEKLRHTHENKKPFIHVELSNLIEKLLDTSEVDYYEGKKYKEIKLIQDEIIKIIRKIIGIN